MNFNQYKKVKKFQNSLITKVNNQIKIKRFIYSIPKSVGRDKFGILTYHKGNGVKKKIRLLDRKFLNIPYRIIEYQYDPYRNTNIALIQYKTGHLAFKLGIHGISCNNIINNSPISPFIKNGMVLPLQKIPISSIISNVQFNKMKSAAIATSAGTYCKLYRKLALP